MPKAEVVRKALAAIKRTADYEYFFDQLSSPDWIKPLWEAGMFRKPPDPVREGDYVRFPLWPESRYLVRMAGRAPENVLEVALHIPETENVRVREDLADVALSIPPSLATRFVVKAKVWLESPYQLRLPEKLGALVSHLARGGYLEGALDLARALLAVIPEQKEEEEGDEGVQRRPAEPKIRIGLHDYEEILEKHVPLLIEKAPERTLQLLCDLLDEAIHSSAREKTDKQEDYSFVWRPAIEIDKRTIGDDPRGLIVSSVRDAAEYISRIDRGEVRKLVEDLEARPWRVFHRIALHLLRLFPDSLEDLIAARLTDKERFETHGLWHEYVLLARDHFARLSPSEQGTILSWIEQGPPIDEDDRARHEEMTGRRLSEGDIKRYVGGWQLRRLWLLRDSLPDEWRLRVERLRAELGEPEHPEFVVYVGAATWVGPTSPKSPEDLRRLSAPEVVFFLRTWQPSREPMTPSPEGLSRILAEVVAAEPERFAMQANLFEGLDPAYVRGLIGGLRDASRQKQIFPWQTVLNLCRWVLDQPREISGREGEYADLDPGWVWTRKAIADLLSEGFGTGPAGMPFELRTAAWEVLAELTEDPDPTPEHEERYGGNNMDPATLSINTTRGEAMHAVVRYGLWIRSHFERDPAGRERLERGFDEMPEVREVLDRHLDPRLDPSLAIRAVYGQWFPWLMLLDPRWAKERVSTIFPGHERERHLHDAAWEAYITFCAPYDDVLEPLRVEYHRAVERISATKPGRRRLAAPEERLAEHLMTFYWRGKVTLDGRDGLLRKFYDRAGDDLRAHALEFVGRSLRGDTAQEIPEGILERLRTLWRWRLEVARAATSVTSCARELAAFGWWFASGEFDDSWAADQLKMLLRLGLSVEPDHLVVKRLATLMETMPEQAIECLRLIVEQDKQGWAIYGWREAASSILLSALRSGNETLREGAELIIHRLGAQGHFEFRDLFRQGRNARYQV